MKARHLMGIAVALGVLLIIAPGAHAGTEITCTFSWDENTEANIKAHSQSAATLKKVSTKEYEQLVGKKVAVKVKRAGGDTCILEHPDNRSIGIKVRKDEFRLDPAGAMPDCNVLQATVECKGMESPSQ